MVRGVEGSVQTLTASKKSAGKTLNDDFWASLGTSLQAYRHTTVGVDQIALGAGPGFRARLLECAAAWEKLPSGELTGGPSEVGCDGFR